MENIIGDNGTGHRLHQNAVVSELNRLQCQRRVIDQRLAELRPFVIELMRQHNVTFISLPNGALHLQPPRFGPPSRRLLTQTLRTLFESLNGVNSPAVSSSDRARQWTNVIWTNRTCHQGNVLGRDWH